MTIVFVMFCRKYDKNQDLEKDNKDYVNKVDINKVGSIHFSFVFLFYKKLNIFCLIKLKEKNQK